jgi:hypothetical protein
MSSREEQEKEEKRRRYLGMLYAQKQAAASKLPFKTHEEEVLEAVGEGILQSKLTNAHLATARRLCVYPSNSSHKPKLASVFTSEGIKIVPYKSTKR